MPFGWLLALRTQLPACHTPSPARLRRSAPRRPGHCGRLRGLRQEQPAVRPAGRDGGAGGVGGGAGQHSVHAAGPVDPGGPAGWLMVFSFTGGLFGALLLPVFASRFEYRTSWACARTCIPGWAEEPWVGLRPPCVPRLCLGTRCGHAALVPPCGRHPPTQKGLLPLTQP